MSGSGTLLPVLHVSLSKVTWLKSVKLLSTVVVFLKLNLKLQHVYSLPSDVLPSVFLPPKHNTFTVKTIEGNSFHPVPLGVVYGAHAAGKLWKKYPIVLPITPVAAYSNISSPLLNFKLSQPLAINRYMYKSII
jgi:hypothetical protein